MVGDLSQALLEPRQQHGVSGLNPSLVSWLPSWGFDPLHPVPFSFSPAVGCEQQPLSERR